MRLATPTLAFAAALSLAASVFATPSPREHDTKPDSKLQEESRLQIIRFVDGEFAKAVVPLPHEKKGFKLMAGKPIDAKALQHALRFEGVSANAGDRVQITKVEFGTHEITFQINGGAKKPFHLMQHLQIGVGPSETAPPVVRDDPNAGLGTSIVLEFGHAVPNLTADQVKADLGQLLDFSTHSATVNWIDTLPAPVQQAIKDHHALVGMDQEMVIAAMGRPDKKVRSRDPETNQETEDWIYGAPPARTTFVTFSGEKVIRVKVFE